MPQHRGPERTRALVLALVAEDKTDEEIVEELRLGLKYVRQLRLEGGIKRSNRKWTADRILKLAKWWFQEFGELTANDWNTGYLRTCGDEVRLRRFYKHGAPHLNTVLQMFGTWNEMKRQAGLPMLPSGAGRRAKRR